MLVFLKRLMGKNIDFSGAHNLSKLGGRPHRNKANQCRKVRKEESDMQNRSLQLHLDNQEL